MLNLLKICALLSITLIFGCATGPSGMTFDSPVGEWSEKYERMNDRGTRTHKFTMIDETKGTYPSSQKVEFYAIDEQRRWKGYWIMKTGTNTNMCSEEKSGSPYWGVQVYQFNETYNQYTGTWDVCGEGQKYKTRGVR